MFDRALAIHEQIETSIGKIFHFAYNSGQLCCMKPDSNDLLFTLLVLVSKSLLFKRKHFYHFDPDPEGEKYPHKCDFW